MIKQAAGRTEKQQFMRMCMTVLQEEKEKEKQQRLLDEESKKAFQSWLLEMELARTYESKLFEEATRLLKEESWEVYQQWLRNHPGFDPYRDLGEDCPYIAYGDYVLIEPYEYSDYA